MHGTPDPPRLLPVLLCVQALVLGAAPWVQGCAVSRLDHTLDSVPPAPATSFQADDGAVASPPPMPTHGAAALTGDMDLSQCIQIALAHRPETRVRWLTLRAAAAALGRAKSPYLPSLDVSMQATVGDPLEPSSPAATPVAYALQAGLGLHYLLFDGGQRAAGVARARASLLGAGFGHNAALREVVRSVELAYYGLLAAQQQEGIAKQSLVQAKQHVALAQARLASDVALRLDVLQAQTATAQATLGWVRARSQTRLARGQLANAMGLSPTVRVRVAEILPEPPQQALGRIRSLLQEAAVHRPELASAQAEIRQARAEVQSAQSRYWPTVTLSAEAGLQLRSGSSRYASWLVGLGATLPLFDGLDREYAIRQARLEAERSAAELIGVARDIELQVWTAYASLKEAGEAIRAAQALQRSAAESARTAEGQYRAGAASIITLVDAQTARAQAGLQLVQARLAWYAGLAELRWAVGRLRGTHRTPRGGGTSRRRPSDGTSPAKAGADTRRPRP